MEVEWYTAPPYSHFLDIQVMQELMREQMTKSFGLPKELLKGEALEMGNQNSAEEKRRYKRIGTSLALEYRDLKKGSELPKGSLLKNIGEGGVCFSSKQFMSLACRLILNITLPNSARPIKAISKVAWIRRLPIGDQYELGNQFLEIAKEDRAQIVDFVNSASAEIQ